MYAHLIVYWMYVYLCVHSWPLCVKLAMTQVDLAAMVQTSLSVIVTILPIHDKNFDSAPCHLSDLPVRSCLD